MTIRHAYEAIARDHLRKHDIHPTGASMTFDEWWQSSCETDNEDGAIKKYARLAWIVATLTERERCARVAEGA